MALNAGITTGVAQGHSGVTLLARVVGQGGRPVTVATIGAISYAIFDLTAGIAGPSGPIPVAGSVYDALQTDPRWTKDSANYPGPDGLTGFNFLFVLGSVWFSPGVIANPLPAPHRYQCEIRFSPAVGEAFVAVFQWVPIQVYS